MVIVAHAVAVPPGPDTVMQYSIVPGGSGGFNGVGPLTVGVPGGGSVGGVPGGGHAKGPVDIQPSNLSPAKFAGVELTTRFALVEIQHTTVESQGETVGSRGIMVTVGGPGGGVPGGGVPGGGVPGGKSTHL